uniref:Cyclin-dependent kinase inhibitor domain-containing protein n=1 Tax=Bracon brevicornis TaxID=1563983 RepID=A0A6V7LQR0_9HYME
MSARVMMNPGALMTDMTRNLTTTTSPKRMPPNREALARVRRDLFGPVDHVAARALAERELRAQSVIDAKRWGFDFRMEIPTNNSRYHWEAIGPQEIVPEPYALRGMPYLRKNAPQTPKKIDKTIEKMRDNSLSPMITEVSKTEKTPPQLPRISEIGHSSRITEKDLESPVQKTTTTTKRREEIIVEPTTPVLPITARKQSSITGKKIYFLMINNAKSTGDTDFCYLDFLLSIERGMKKVLWKKVVAPVVLEIC